MEKRHVYIRSDWADKIEQAVSDESQKAIIEQLIAESKKEYRLNYESLQEDVLIYKALMLQTKIAFKEAKEEYVKSSYELWENFEKELPSVREKTQHLINQMSPIKNELAQINSMLDSLKAWKFNDLIKAIEAINSTDSKTLDMIKFLVDNYKTKE